MEQRDITYEEIAGIEAKIATEINEKNKEMNKKRQSIEQRPFNGDYNKIQTNNS